MFARRLDRIGIRFGFPEALIGLLTALAADGPEISSAVFALIKGQHDVGVGVLVGSCTFNIASMLGVSAIVAGQVFASRATLALEGAVAGAVTMIAVLALLGSIASGLAGVLALVVGAIYLLRMLRTAEWPSRSVDQPSHNGTTPRITCSA